MRGHSPFVQERKGDGMGHKPTPCCGCKDTKKASFTSAPVDDSKEVLFTLMLNAVSLCADKEFSLLCAASLKTAGKCKNLGTKWSPTPRTH